MTPEFKKNLYVVSGICALLIVSVVLVFGQTAQFEFVNFDDGIYVYNNPHVAQGLCGESIGWACTSLTGSNWHPLTWMSHMLDVQIYGQKNAGGHHATNVALHAAVVVSLFLVLWRMTGSLWPSALVAMVFAVHPLRAESVAWVSERKDLLSGLFFMLTLAAYLGYVRHPFSWRRYLLVVAVFALGLTAKPMLVTLPCVLLLLDYWPLGRMPFSPGADAEQAESWGGSCTATPEQQYNCRPNECSGGASRRLLRLAVEKIPLFALVAGSCVITSVAQQSAMVALDALPLSTRIGNALVSCVAYLGQFFYPVGLAAFYPMPLGGHSLWKIVSAAAVLIVISAAVFLCRRNRPYLLVGWLWYLGMLVPVIGLVQVGSQSMADRYTYLPQIGLTVAIVWGVAGAARGWTFRRWAYAAASVALAAVLTTAAWGQVSTWRDSETLWNHALACTERNVVAHNNLAIVLANRNQLEVAAEHCRKAVDIMPRQPMFRENLGGVLDAEGKTAEADAEFRKVKEGPILAAIEHYRTALKIPASSESVASTHNNLGNALAALHRIDEAAAEYRNALKVKPAFMEAHNNLGNVLAAAGRGDDAIAEYRRALEIDPNYVEARSNLGAALAGRGRLDEAIAEFQKILELEPDNAVAHNNLGIALHQQGKTAAAVVHWREAVRLDPTNVHNVNRLAQALATCPDASVRDGKAAIELALWATQLSKSREAIPFDTLAAAYAEAGNFSEAVLSAKNALRLASREKNPALAESIKKKIALYEARTPFREPNRPSTTAINPPQQTVQNRAG